MIFLDSDVVIDLLREYPPAVAWFNSLNGEDTMALSGFVVMELVQGCQNRQQQKLLQRHLSLYEIIWLHPIHCDKALDIFVQHHLTHDAGLLDVLVGQTAVSLETPLYTFNLKHYYFVPGLKIIQPYKKLS